MSFSPSQNYVQWLQIVEIISTFNDRERGDIRDEKLVASFWEYVNVLDENDDENVCSKLSHNHWIR